MAKRGDWDEESKDTGPRTIKVTEIIEISNVLEHIVTLRLADLNLFKLTTLASLPSNCLSKVYAIHASNPDKTIDET